MSVNKDLPHIIVLPEDDANRQLVNGFLKVAEMANDKWARQVQVLPSARGWTHVRNKFEKTHLKEMEKYPARHMVLLIDFDESDKRREDMHRVIPESVTKRVFVIGAWSEAEKLKKPNRDSLESFGEKLANDCQEMTETAWRHELLQHNQEELARMIAVLRPILF